MTTQQEQTTPTMEQTQKVKAPKKKSKTVLEKEAMEAEMRAMKEQMRVMKEKAQEQEELIKKQDNDYLKLMLAKQAKKTGGGKPKGEVQHQPHYRFRSIETDDGQTEILMLDSEVGQEIPLYDKKVEFSALLEGMMSLFNDEYQDCSETYDDLFVEEVIEDNFGSNLTDGERDVFYLKDRTKYWNEMTKEELIKTCRERHYLSDFKSRTKNDFVEPNWAKTAEGEWVKWGKGTLYGLKKDVFKQPLKPKVAVHLKTTEGREQIKTAPEESRCEANSSKSAGRCCKKAMFVLPEDGKYVSRRVCITHMKLVHQTSILTKTPLAFGCRWGWLGNDPTCLKVGEHSKTIDQYCKDKLKSKPDQKVVFDAIKSNTYEGDDVGNNDGYKQFKIRD